jgi:hypothetical protein
VAVVSVVVLALNGEDGDAVVADERRGDIILRRKRIRGAEHHVRTAIAQCDGEISRLGGDVQAG